MGIYSLIVKVANIYKPVMVTNLAFNELIQGQTIQGVKITAGDRWILAIKKKKKKTVEK